MISDHTLNRSASFLDSWLEYQVGMGGLPGFVVGVYHKNRFVYKRAFGMANLEDGELLTTDHLFNVGSQAKMFTALAVLTLAQSKKLALDDCAVKYLPWLAQHSDPRFQYITLRQLLWHRAGMIREGGQADFWQLQASFPDEPQLKKLVLSSDLVQVGGDMFKYSNLGYALLGLVIAKASGSTYVDYVREHILTPLQMTATNVYDVSREKRTATAYLRPLNGSRPTMPKAIPTHAFDSVTGWYSTLDDLGRFANGLFGNVPQWMGSSALQQLFTNEHHHWVPPEQRGTEYGLGFFIEHSNGRKLIGHTGGFSGYHTCTYVDVDNQQAVIVLANAKDTPVSSMAEGILGVYDFFTQQTNQPLSANLQRYNVRLMNLWETFEIVSTPDSIVCIDPTSWVPFDDVKTLEVVDGATLRVVQDDDLSYNSETVKFYFDSHGIATHVNYAGITCVSEPEYASWVEKQKDRIR